MTFQKVGKSFPAIRIKQFEELVSMSLGFPNIAVKKTQAHCASLLIACAGQHTARSPELKHHRRAA